MLVAGDALRSSEPWNRAVTTAFAQRLEALEVVNGDELDAAIEAVEGDWWSFGAARKRHLDTGLDGDRAVTPWLVSGSAFAPRVAAQPIAVPTLEDVLGHDFTNLVRYEITPRILESNAILAIASRDGDVVDPDADFPILIDVIRSEIGVAQTRP